MRLPLRREPVEGEGAGAHVLYFGQSLAYMIVTAVTGQDPEATADGEDEVEIAPTTERTGVQ